MVSHGRVGGMRGHHCSGSASRKASIISPAWLRGDATSDMGYDGGKDNGMAASLSTI